MQRTAGKNIFNFQFVYDFISLTSTFHTNEAPARIFINKITFCISCTVADARKISPFSPMFHFYTPWKHQKTSSFLIFSGGIEVEHWLKMGYQFIETVFCMELPLQ